jgi:hypothetical protein
VFLVGKFTIPFSAGTSVGADEVEELGNGLDGGIFPAILTLASDEYSSSPWYNYLSLIQVTANNAITFNILRHQNKWKRSQKACTMTRWSPPSKT